MKGNRIDARFAALRQSGRTGLVPFFTAGDPALDATVPVMHALVAAGADLIELGVPFSDPMADGPVIQQSSERALSRGVGLARVLADVARFRERDSDTPVVLMGYLNPVEIFGLERFAEAAARAGVDGTLLVDCPPEEAEAMRAVLEPAGLHLIALAAPTSDEARLAQLIEGSSGYLYYVSFAGVTGASRLDAGAVEARVAALRQRGKLPVAVGFGVKDADTARAIGRFADAVVIGSALVERLSGADGAAQAAERAGTFLAPIRAALDEA